MRSLAYLRRRFSTTGVLRNRCDFIFLFFLLFVFVLARFAQPEESTWEESNQDALNDRHDRYQKNFNRYAFKNEEDNFPL